MLPQAVQMLPECWMKQGQQLQITAQHDSYAISFTSASTDSNVHAAATEATDRSSFTTNSASTGPAEQASVPPARLESLPTSAPLVDHVWRAAYDQLADLQCHLAKAATQDPLEYRRLVTAAALLTMQPWGSSSPPSITHCSDETPLAGSKHAKQPRKMCTDQAEPFQELGSVHEKPLERSAANLEQARDVVMSATAKSVDQECKDVWPTADPHHAAAMLVRLFS
jgi:hypothetical protein